MEILELLDARNKRVENYSYKLLSGGYGLDVAISDDLDIDENQMSVVINFADGNRRDGVGDLLEVSGINTERHRKNPLILWDHAKQVTLPIGLAQNPGNNHYTVEIDPQNRIAKAKCFFYQGKGMSQGDDYEHAIFCEQLFDLIAKRYIRGGSIGYQVISCRELPPDYERGIPKGLHLLGVNMLEASVVTMPANQDTVRKCLSLSKVCGKPLSPMLVKSLTPYAPEKKVIVSVEDNEKALRPSHDTPDTSHRQYEERYIVGDNQSPERYGAEMVTPTNSDAHQAHGLGSEDYTDKPHEERVRRNPKREEEDRKRRAARGGKSVRGLYRVKARGSVTTDERKLQNSSGESRGDRIMEQANPHSNSTPEEDEEEFQRDQQEMEEVRREFERNKKKNIRETYRVKATRNSRGPDREKLNQAQTRSQQDLRQWWHGDNVMEDVIDPAIEIDPETELPVNPRDDKTLGRKHRRKNYRVKAKREFEPDEEKLTDASNSGNDRSSGHWHLREAMSGRRSSNTPEEDENAERQLEEDYKEKLGKKDIKSDYFQNCPRDETGHCLPKNEEDRGKDRETSHVRQGRREAHSPRTLEFGIFPGKTHTRSRKDALKVFADKQSASEYAKKYKNEHEQGLIVAKIGGDEKSLGRVQVKGPIQVSSEPDDEGRYQLHHSGRRIGTDAVRKESAENMARAINDDNRRVGRDKKRDGSSRSFDTDTGYDYDEDQPRTEKSIPKKVKGPIGVSEPDEEGRHHLTQEGRRFSEGDGDTNRQSAENVARYINEDVRTTGEDKKRDAWRRRHETRYGPIESPHLAEEPRTEKSVTKKDLEEDEEEKGTLASDEEPDEHGYYHTRQSGRSVGRYHDQQGAQTAAGRDEANYRSGEDKKKRSHRSRFGYSEQTKCLYANIKSIRALYKGRHAVVGRHSDPVSPEERYILVDRETGGHVENSHEESPIRKEEREYDKNDYANRGIRESTRRGHRRSQEAQAHQEEYQRHQTRRQRLDNAKEGTAEHEDIRTEKGIKAKPATPTRQQLRSVGKDDLHRARSRTVGEHVEEFDRAVNAGDSNAGQHAVDAGARDDMDQARAQRRVAARERRNKDMDGEVQQKAPKKQTYEELRDRADNTHTNRIRSRTSAEHMQASREAEDVGESIGHIVDADDRDQIDRDRVERGRRTRSNKKSLEDENTLRDKYIAEFKELEELTKKLDSLFIE